MNQKTLQMPGDKKVPGIFKFFFQMFERAGFRGFGRVYEVKFGLTEIKHVKKWKQKTL